MPSDVGLFWSFGFGSILGSFLVFVVFVSLGPLFELFQTPLRHLEAIGLKRCQNTFLWPFDPFWPLLVGSPLPFRAPKAILGPQRAKKASKGHPIWSKMAQNGLKINFFRFSVLARNALKCPPNAGCLNRRGGGTRLPPIWEILAKKKGNTE